jgi:hypothetical protein
MSALAPVTDVRRQLNVRFRLVPQLPTFEMIKKASIRATLSPGIGRPPRSSEFSCSPGWFGVKVDAAHYDARRISFELPG